LSSLFALIGAIIGAIIGDKLARYVINHLDQWFVIESSDQLSDYGFFTLVSTIPTFLILFAFIGWWLATRLTRR